MEYIRKDIPLWSITIWDKKFNNVEKEWQPQVKKYKYLLADELDSIRTESGDIRILYTGKDTGFTTEELAGDAIAEGEVVTIPWGGIPTVKYHKGKFVTGDNRIATSSDPTLLTNKYLYYFMKGNTKTIASFYRGASLKHPSMRDVLKMSISFPTVDEQNQIVQQFDCLEQLIDLRQQELKKLDELIKARFVELFGDPMVNPKGYPIKTYGELFELNAGGTPSKTKPEYWENGTISWIGSNLCQNVILYENDGKYISQEGYDHSSARLFPVDTVLIALVGATIGKTALLKFETSTNQNVLGVRHIVESGYNPMFVYYYTQFLYQKFMSIGDGGFNMASKGFVSELPIYDVELAAQNKFSAFAKQVDKSKFI